MKTAAKPKQKGFGAAAATKPKKKKRASVIPLDPSVEAALDALSFNAGGDGHDADASIAKYLNPKHTENPEKMKEIAERLQAGDVVVLRDAFRPEFAEMVYTELNHKEVAWELNEDYFPDGYAHRHHNVYDRGSFSARLNATFGVFKSEASKAFMSELAGRDCSGETTGAPSWYKEGDHSLPHTDWVGQRTVSYVWHLSKDWRPEWGGALYWAQHDHGVATYPASFNTLVLFSVTTTSAHFVTTVSPHHKGKRLTFNGWWQSSWLPQADDETVEEVLSDDVQRRAVTHTQIQAVTDLVNDPWQNLPAGRREELERLRKQWMDDFFPQGSRAGIEA